MSFMNFSVDTSEAGQGDIDTEVSVNGQLVRTSRTRIDASHHRYVFTPQVNEDHVVSVMFNYDAVPGTLSNFPSDIIVIEEKIGE